MSCFVTFFFSPDLVGYKHVDLNGKYPSKSSHFPLPPSNHTTEIPLPPTFFPSQFSSSLLYPPNETYYKGNSHLLLRFLYSLARTRNLIAKHGRQNICYAQKPNKFTLFSKKWKTKKFTSHISMLQTSDKGEKCLLLLLQPLDFNLIAHCMKDITLTIQNATFIFSSNSITRNLKSESTSVLCISLYSLSYTPATNQS